MGVAADSLQYLPSDQRPKHAVCQTLGSQSCAVEDSVVCCVTVRRWGSGLRRLEGRIVSSKET